MTPKQKFRLCYGWSHCVDFSTLAEAEAAARKLKPNGFAQVYVYRWNAKQEMYDRTPVAEISKPKPRKPKVIS
jgi:hypothetical protein